MTEGSTALCVIAWRMCSVLSAAAGIVLGLMVDQGRLGGPSWNRDDAQHLVSDGISAQLLGKPRGTCLLAAMIGGAIGASTGGSDGMPRPTPWFLHLTGKIRWQMGRALRYIRSPGGALLATFAALIYGREILPNHPMALQFLVLIAAALGASQRLLGLGFALVPIVLANPLGSNSTVPLGHESLKLIDHLPTIGFLFASLAGVSLLLAIGSREWKEALGHGVIALPLSLATYQSLAPARNPSVRWVMACVSIGCSGMYLIYLLVTKTVETEDEYERMRREVWEGIFLSMSAIYFLVVAALIIWLIFPRPSDAIGEGPVFCLIMSSFFAAFRYLAGRTDFGRFFFHEALGAPFIFGLLDALRRSFRFALSGIFILGLGSIPLSIFFKGTLFGLLSETIAGISHGLGLLARKSTARDLCSVVAFISFCYMFHAFLFTKRVDPRVSRAAWELVRWGFISLLFLRWWGISRVETLRYESHDAAISSMAVHPSGSEAYAGDLKGRVWRLMLPGAADGRGLARIEEISQIKVAIPVWSLACSPDGRFLAVGIGEIPRSKGSALSLPRDCMVKVWEIGTDKKLAEFGALMPVRVMAISSGNLLAYAVPWLETRKLPDGTLDGLGAPGTGRAIFRAVACFPDSNSLVTADSEGHLRSWFELRELSPYLKKDVADKLARFRGGARDLLIPFGIDLSQGTPVGCLAISPSGREVLAGDEACVLRLWLADGSNSEIGRFIGHGGPITSVAISPDGHLALSVSEDGTVRLWDISSRRELRRYGPLMVNVNAVAFTPDGRHVLSGGDDGSVRLWKVPQ